MEFRILRREVPLVGEWCEACPVKLEPLDTLRMVDIEKPALVGRRVDYQDSQVSYGHIYVYQVLSVGERGYESPPSNRVVIYWDTPPYAPARLEGVAQSGEAVLNWDAVPDGEEYRIYRRRRDGSFEGDPVGSVGSDELSYRDTGLSNGVEYGYVVRATRRLGKTWLEGSSSEEISLTPEDLTPPAPPQGLLAVPLSVGIELIWQRNVDPDLLGYFVYRRDPEGGQYRPLNGSPLEGTTYVDRTAIVGRVYEYVVTAVDSSPRRNESAFSESVSVKYLR
jgi:fibronectin type 3 domain-containing protein